MELPYLSFIVLLSSSPSHHESLRINVYKIGRQKTACGCVRLEKFILSRSTVDLPLPFRIESGLRLRLQSPLQ